MRILYAVHQFFPHFYTGTERFVLNLSKYMQKLGHHPEVLTYGLAETQFNGKFENLLFKEYHYQNIPVLSVKHSVETNELNFEIFNKDLEKFLLNQLESNFYDVLHIAHPMRIGEVLKVANKLGVPSVLTLTDFWIFCPRAIAVTSSGKMCSNPENGNRCVRECYNSQLEDKIMKRFNESVEFLGNVNTVVSPTKFLARIIREIYGIDVKVIRHGIDYTPVKQNVRYKREGDTVVFGYIGTVLPHKGVHIIVEALKLIKNKNIRVKIYGHHFHERNYYEDLIMRTQHDERVSFLGEYKDEELPRIMNEIDCTIVPSIWWENSPLTVLTSLAYKVPVITTNIGGAAELVKDGVNGFNFEIGNPKSLAEVMSKIAENPEILNDIKSKIKRPPRVEEEAFEYEKIYKAVSGGG